MNSRKRDYFNNEKLLGNSLDNEGSGNKLLANSF